MNRRPKNRTRRRLSVAACAIALALCAASAPAETAEFTAEEAYSRLLQQIEPGQVPTGILLESRRGLGHGLVLSRDGGEEAKSLSAAGFRAAYGHLVGAPIGVPLPPLEELSSRASIWRDAERATPIGLVLIDYDTAADQLSSAELIDGVLQVPEGRLGETRRFVAAQAFTERAVRWSPRFVVPSDLLVVHGFEPEAITRLTVRFGDGPSQRIVLDQPFTARRLPAQAGTLRFSVTAQIGESRVTARGEVPYYAPRQQPTDPPLPDPILQVFPPPNPPQACVRGDWEAENATGSRLIPFYDLQGQVIGSPYVSRFDGPTTPAGVLAGELNLRVIPGAPGNVQVTGLGACVFRLANPVFLVDGFDVFNNRSRDTIMVEIGPTIQELVAFGFDVVLVDYHDGRDWLQRNGRALRELLVNRLDDLVTDQVLFDDRVAVIAGSMGTQVTRWALMEAEGLGEDHNTGLFLAIDGPFDGANIPIGFQAAAQDSDDFRPALESPAASQLLRYSYPLPGIFPPENFWYEERPDYTEFYFVDLPNLNPPHLLPVSSRNVAAANGSWDPQSRQTASLDAVLLDSELVVSTWYGYQHTRLRVRGDGPGSEVFRRSDCSFLFGIPAGCDNQSLPLPPQLGDAADTVAGGSRATTLDFIAGIQQLLADLPPSQTVSFEQHLWEHDRHAFIPTASALAGGVWDNQTAEKCNTPHVEVTPVVSSLLFRELLAFRDPQAPPPAQAPGYQAGCGQPESVDYCFPGVVWYEQPSQPDFLEATLVAGDCRVAAVPPGETGLLVGDRYAVQPVAGCDFGGPLTGGACPLFDLGPNVHGLALTGGGGFSFFFFNQIGGPGCPPGSTGGVVSSDVLTTTVSCQVTPAPGLPLADLSVDGSVVAVPPAIDCNVGVPLVADGQPICYLGSAPGGSTAGFDGSFFSYDGEE